MMLVTHADYSTVVMVGLSPAFVCMSVFYDISTTNAARITKLDIQIFHNKSWKPIYFGVTQNSANVGLCTHMIAGFL